MSQFTILDLPAEILSNIFCRLRYKDLVAISKSCHQAHEFCSPENQTLWQSVFLHDYDDPRDRWASLTKTHQATILERQATFDWFVELRKRVIALNYDTLIDDTDADVYEHTIETILDIVDTAKSCNSLKDAQSGRVQEIDDRDLSLNITMLPTNYAFTARFAALIRGHTSSVIQRGPEHYGLDQSTVNRLMPGGWEERPRPFTRSMAGLEHDKIIRSDNASRLHVLAGLSEWEIKDEKSMSRARRVTYNLNTTNSRNEYGPWKDDLSGEVDWQRLEAIFAVVARQFTTAVKGRMTLPQGFCFSIPHRTLVDPTIPDDWAGVSGNWVGTYVFLHWERLLEFNTFINATNRPTLENGDEDSGGLMKLELKLDMRLKDDARLWTSMPYCKDLQPLYFSGLSKSYDFQMATHIRGMCCLAPNGREVRWRYIVQ